MTFLEKIQSLLLPQEPTEFYRNGGIFLGSLLFVAGGIMYYQVSTTSELRNSLQKLYKTKTEAKNILARLQEVTKQSEEVNKLLEDDKNFRLKNYFDDVVRQLGFSSNIVKEPDVTEDVLQKLYTEVKITAQFRNLSTKNLCQLLQAFEEKDRVYMKDLAITKKNTSLDVTLSIATLKSHIAKKG